ncbi:MAG: STAS domain-containing protein [Chloroflexota bacterium]
MLCERLPDVLDRSDVEVVLCDVGGLLCADAATLDGLARLQLAARRRGRELRLWNASEELHGLLAMAGLCDIVGLCWPDSGHAAGRPARTQGSCPPDLKDPGARAVRRAGTSWPCRGRT